MLVPKDKYYSFSNQNGRESKIISSDDEILSSEIQPTVIPSVSSKISKESQSNTFSRENMVKLIQEIAPSCFRCYEECHWSWIRTVLSSSRTYITVCIIKFKMMVFTKELLLKYCQTYTGNTNKSCRLKTSGWRFHPFLIWRIFHNWCFLSNVHQKISKCHNRTSEIEYAFMSRANSNTTEHTISWNQLWFQRTCCQPRSIMDEGKVQHTSDFQGCWN